MAEAYADKHGLELDRELTFHDIGVSAFRGQNADEGRLAYFMEAVRAGQVPQGSVLLVEQLDRISRLTPLRALDVLRGITREGVGVVTLNDGKEYTQESLEGLPMDLIMSILTFTRANEESATKAKRLKAAWEAKRAKIGTHPLTSVSPAWLKLSEDRSGFEVIAERAVLVRRMFSMTVQGVGQHMIAATFNKEGHAPWGRGKMWHRSYIAKTLANPAVIGRFQPHALEFDGGRKHRTPTGRPIEHYFPAIVTVEDFEEVQSLRLTKSAPQRGRHANMAVSNVLAGLATCSVCGSTMTRVNKGKRGRPSYVCSRAKAGAGCSYRSIRCDVVEEAILEVLPERLEGHDGAGVDAALDALVRGAEERVDDLRVKATRWADRLLSAEDVTGERSKTLAQRLAATERDLHAAEEALGDLREREAALTGATIGVRIEKALEALKKPPEERSAPDINLALRLIFERVAFQGGTVPTGPEGPEEWRWQMLVFEWKHGGDFLIPLHQFSAWPGPKGDGNRRK